ncbi:MAG TPA: BatA domain-containing protein [Vicinamibacterales bacterium]|nr:BatA domain-containing protein [Vicinamibacterales bacterium]
MSFLSPLFLVGLGAIAIPVLIHLIQRERKRVVQFPSLMFVRRIPYQSVRRRRIRHWLLLALRAAAIACIVAAFARPFFRQSAIAAAAAGGSREIVVLLDQSASMGYGDHWQRAQDAARQAVRSLGGDERGTLVLFSRNAEENMRATTDHGRLEGAIGAARVGSDATRYGPALKLAESILARSSAKRREAVLISDFQRAGWSGSEDAHFPEGMTLTPVSVASSGTVNLSVPSVTFARSSFSGQERVSVTAGLANRSDQAMTNTAVTLSIDGHDLQTLPVTIGARASTAVTFTPFTLAEPNVRGSVRAGTDPLPADNVFHFVLAPSAPVSILIIDSGAQASESLYLSKALSIGTAPAFRVDLMPAARVTPAAFDGRAVVVLNDAAFPSGAGNGVLTRFVERGGGLLVIFGEHSAWPSGDTDLLPGTLGAVTDPANGRGGAIGFIDYSHPVFEVFRAPRSGDFSSAHIFRYRALAAGPGARILARFDNGAVAAAERRVGAGRVIAWTSTLDDSWSDLAVKPVYLPLVHQLMRYLGHYEQPLSWQTVGQVLDLPAASNARGDRVIVTPSGQRISQAAGAAGLVELNEQGTYEIRGAAVPGAAAPGAGVVPGAANRPRAIAVNLDPAESDLTPLDPRELVAAVTGHATPVAAQPLAPEATREDAEKRQALWWYLLLTGLLLLAAETTIANRLSRREKFL